MPAVQNRATANGGSELVFIDMEPENGDYEPLLFSGCRRGDALRVMSGIAPGDLARVLDVLFTGEDSP